ncbi:hypothetical protein C8R43DRAFT_1233475 [Mycena crocata]|nr:hypothetical protein C8R43DRAFT_1233475 [Mycena crocata]
MESPFSQHFKTNYVPSDSEINLIRAHVVPHTKELARLEGLIQDLITQRDQIAEYIDLHTAIISPARRLPHDIVQEIFLACLPTHRNAAMSSTEAPLLLCAISSEWRALALATPMLWAALHVDLDFVLARSFRLSCLRAWMARSAQCALSLSVSAYSASCGFILASLLSSSSRWRSITLDIAPPLVATLKNVDAPRLEAIELRGDAITPAASSLFRSKRIRSVHLSQRDLAQFMRDIPLAYEHLTHLCLLNNNEGDVESTGFILSILAKCPRLISFRFQVGPLSVNGQTPVEKISLPSLEIIDICPPFNSTAARLSNILDHLLMPELRTFRIPLTSLAQSEDDTRFLASLVAGSPKLETLHLGLTSVTRQPLFDALRSLRCLTTLHITEFCTMWWDEPVPDLPFAKTEDLLELLTSEDVCPALQDVYLARANASRERVLMFAGTRIVEKRPLRRLHVQFQGIDERPDVIPDFQASLSCLMDLAFSFTGNKDGNIPSTPWTGLQNGDWEGWA